MSVLSIQIDRLRETADEAEKLEFTDRVSISFMHNKLAPMLREAADTIESLRDRLQVEVEPTERTCKLEPLEAFEVAVNMLDQTEWGVCSNCGTASPNDATYCCECGAKVVEA